MHLPALVQFSTLVLRCTVLWLRTRARVRHTHLAAE